MKAKHMDNGIQYFSTVMISIIIITIHFTRYFPVIIIIIMIIINFTCYFPQCF